MKTLKSICVYCGASQGNSTSYTQAASLVGKTFAQKGIRLVYGGGNVGLMGTIANAALQAGGEVIGVIPKSMIEKEWAHTGLTELKIVKNMHERKATMEQDSEAFIALPGGFGTLDELFEIITWAQLDYHNKPVGILNVDGYFDPLIKFMDHSVHHGFVKQTHRDMIAIDSDIDSLIKKLQAI